MRSQTKILVLLLILSFGLVGCSSSNVEDVQDANKTTSVEENVDEIENIRKMTNEVVVYMTNIKNNYEEKLSESSESAERYLDNVYRGPAISEKKDKIKNLVASSKELEDLKSKLSGIWLHFTNVLLEMSNDKDQDSIDRSVEVITNNLDFIDSVINK